MVQFDIKTLFFYGDIFKEYMQQAKGFENSWFPYQIYKLHKSIYGLKQAYFES
jgi:hypothetical protein